MTTLLWWDFGVDAADTELAGEQPLYLALADRVQDEMGQAATGTRVASEPELVARFGVSRLTARAALQELERRWLVRRRRGSGTYWVQRIDFPVGPGLGPSLLTMMRRADAQLKVSVDSVRTRRPVASIRDRLDLDPDDKAVAVTRTGWSAEVPAWHGTTHLPHELVDGIADLLADRSTGPTRAAEAVSITEVLGSGFGLDPQLGWVRAELVVAPVAVARALDVEGRPLAWQVEIEVDDAQLGRPVAFTECWLRPDVFRVRLEG